MTTKPIPKNDGPFVGVGAEVKFVSNYDGDTMDFELTRKIKIRVASSDGRYFDTPEIRGAEDKAPGLAVRDMVRDLMTRAERIIVQIPSDGDEYVLDIGAVGDRSAGYVFLFLDGQWQELTQLCSAFLK